MNITKAAVLGAGTMGAGIAAHLANAGIPTLLLDIAPSELTPDEEKKGLTLESPAVRNRIVNSLFEAAKKLKPMNRRTKKRGGSLLDDLKLFFRTYYVCRNHNNWRPTGSRISAARQVR